MKSLLPLVALMSGPALAQHDPVPTPLVMIDVKEVFVPVGFDDNDDALAVLDGYLPDTCYKLAHNEAFFDQGSRTFKVIQWARKFDGVCVEVPVPFFKEVSLGVLPEGDYTVRATGADAQALNVKEATSSGPDDFLYAPVDSVKVESDPQTGKYWAIIQGRFTNSCMTWEDVKVVDSGRSIEVLPVIDMAGRDDCHATELPFSWMVDLPRNMETGRHLVHVRSLNGKSVNQVFSKYPERRPQPH